METLDNKMSDSFVACCFFVLFGVLFGEKVCEAVLSVGRVVMRAARCIEGGSD